MEIQCSHDDAMFVVIGISDNGSDNGLACGGTAVIEYRVLTPPAERKKGMRSVVLGMLA